MKIFGVPKSRSGFLNGGPTNEETQRLEGRISNLEHEAFLNTPNTLVICGDMGVRLDEITETGYRLRGLGEITDTIHSGYRLRIRRRSVCDINLFFTSGDLKKLSDFLKK